MNLPSISVSCASMSQRTVTLKLQQGPHFGKTDKPIRTLRAQPAKHRNVTDKPGLFANPISNRFTRYLKLKAYSATKLNGTGRVANVPILLRLSFKNSRGGRCTVQSRRRPVLNMTRLTLVFLFNDDIAYTALILNAFVFSCVNFFTITDWTGSLHSSLSLIWNRPTSDHICLFFLLVSLD
jgi:hypothetical protein